MIAVYSVPVYGAESLLVINEDSYDFSANIRGETTGGDLYYVVYEGIGLFCANNLGQRGLQDVGDIGKVPLDEVAIPNENYLQQGVPAVLGHTYVSLAQEGEEGHVIVFRIAAISDNYSSVQILYLYEFVQLGQMQPTDQVQPTYPFSFPPVAIYLIAFFLVIGVVSTAARFISYRRKGTTLPPPYEPARNNQSTRNQAMRIFEEANFIFKHEKKDDSITIFGGDSKPLCLVIHEHSMKMPQVISNIPIPRKMRTTDVRIERKDGELLGEIHEFPTGTMRLIRKWKVFDQNFTYKGVVCEKPKFMGNDWVLQNVEDNLLAVIEGDRKKHNYEIVTSDRSKQSIARCTSLNEDSYRVELMVSSIDPFLVLNYVIVLDLAKTAAIISGAGRP